jgi:NtrC-family two-component system sensor histidine kinase KinB
MLRTRLMLGLVCLLVIVLSMGLYSISQCSELGKRIEKLGLENDKIGRDLRTMKESGATMTASLLDLAVGNAADSRPKFEKAVKNFQKALDEEEQRAPTSDPDEKKTLDQVSDSFKKFTGSADKFFLEPQLPGEVWRNSANQLGMEVAQLLDEVDQLAAAHQASLTKESQNSNSRIIWAIRTLWLMMTVAAMATLMAYLGLNRGLLVPVRSLTASIKKVGEGHLDQEVPVLSSDELGVLSVSFNQMAAQLREYQANTSVELLRLNETIRATLASFPDPVFVLNQAGVVKFRNPAADQLAMKLLFAGVTRLPEKVDVKVEEVRASEQDYLPTSFQDAVKFHIDGQDRYFLPRIVILRTEKGDKFGVAVILENVTRMLLLDDVKSNMIATVSHELKTPMTSVRMALYLLYEKVLGPLNDKQTELVTAAREDSDRLLKTLNDLLDLAKLEQGPTQLNLRDYAPKELVEKAQLSTQELANGAGIKIRTEIAPKLADVRVDPQRLAYVFTNFVTNAIKYAPASSDLVLKATPAEMRNSTPCDSR